MFYFGHSFAKRRMSSQIFIARRWNKLRCWCWETTDRNIARSEYCGPKMRKLWGTEPSWIFRRVLREKNLLFKKFELENCAAYLSKNNVSKFVQLNWVVPCNGRCCHYLRAWRRWQFLSSSQVNRSEKQVRPHGIHRLCQKLTAATRK